MEHSQYIAMQMYSDVLQRKLSRSSSYEKALNQAGLETQPDDPIANGAKDSSATLLAPPETTKSRILYIFVPLLTPTVPPEPEIHTNFFSQVGPRVRAWTIISISDAVFVGDSSGPKVPNGNHQAAGIKSILSRLTLEGCLSPAFEHGNKCLFGKFSCLLEARVGSSIT